MIPTALSPSALELHQALLKVDPALEEIRVSFTVLWTFVDLLKIFRHAVPSIASRDFTLTVLRRRDAPRKNSGLFH